MNSPDNLPLDPTVARCMAALTALRDIARALVLELDVERLLRKIIRAAVQLPDAAGGSLLVRQPEEDVLVFTVAAGEGAEWLEGRRIKVNQGIAGWIMNHREAVLINDVRRDFRFSGGIDKSLGIRTHSLIGVPLMARGRVLGVIEVINKRGGVKFDETDLETLLALADQAAIAIVNARLHQQVLRNKSQFVAVENQIHRKLARDFYDGPAQALDGVVMDIECAQKLLKRDRRAAHAELEHIKETARRALNQVHNAVFELHPIVLETQGLVAALRAYIVRLKTVEPALILLHTNGVKHRLPAVIEKACFFVIREAVSNARKHANFDRLDITLAFRGGELVVLVEDNGRGFDVKKVYHSGNGWSNWGLCNMHERAKLIGGRLYVSAIPGQGTSITLIVPLSTEVEPYAPLYPDPLYPFPPCLPDSTTDDIIFPVVSAI